MEIDLKVLNQLVTVARTGNISRAADELHLSQPALSRSIAAFEKQFGVRLFDRGRQGASLTPVGAIAITEAQALIKQASAISHNLRLYGEGTGGKINLGMGPLIASIVLPELGRHFLQHRPQLQIQTTIKSASQLMPDLLSDQIELLFAAVPQLDIEGDIKATPLASISIAHVVRTEHPLAAIKGTLSKAQLDDYPVLCGSELSRIATGAGGFLCDNYHILREICLTSDSIWICSEQLVSEEIAAGQLATLAMEESHSPPEQVELAVLRREALTLSPAAEAITQFIQQFFAGKNLLDNPVSS